MIENYLNDAEVLDQKQRSKWEENLPLLIVLLGFDLDLLKTYVTTIDEKPKETDLGSEVKDGQPFNESDREKEGSPIQLRKRKISSLKWIGAVFIVVCITTIFFWPKPEVPPKSTIMAYELCGDFRDIKSPHASQDSIAIKVTDWKSEKAVVNGQDTTALGMITLELLIQNNSTSTHYIFEEILMRTHQNRSISGKSEECPIKPTSQSLRVFTLSCGKPLILSASLLTSSVGKLKPGKEVSCWVSFVPDSDCSSSSNGFRAIPFQVGFNLKYHINKERNTKIFWMKEVLSLAVD